MVDRVVRLDDVVEQGLRPLAAGQVTGKVLVDPPWLRSRCSEPAGWAPRCADAWSGAGHHVRLWNRTAERRRAPCASTVPDAGLDVAATPAAAVG